MFDKHVHVSGADQHHYHRSEVHEHRAPTDQSVQLLREIEAAALKKIQSAVRLPNCEISCVVHTMVDSCGMQVRLCAIYALNGQRHRVEHVELEGLGVDVDLAERCVIGLRDALAKDIANRLLGPAISACGKKFLEGVQR